MSKVTTFPYRWIPAAFRQTNGYWVDRDGRFPTKSQEEIDKSYMEWINLTSTKSSL